MHLYREWAADQLVSLVRNQHIPKQEAWVMSVMRFLFLHAFYRQTRPVQSATIPELARKGPSPALTMQTHDMCAQRVFSLLGELSSWLPSTGASDADTAKALEGDNHRHSHALDGVWKEHQCASVRLCRLCVVLPQFVCTCVYPPPPFPP